MKVENEPKSQQWDGVPTHELLDRLIKRGEAESIAKKLRVTFQTVRNWCRERQSADGNGTGRHNPLDAVVAIVETWNEGERDGRPAELANWVARLCGGVFVPLYALANDTSAVGTVIRRFGLFLERTMVDGSPPSQTVVAAESLSLITLLLSILFSSHPEDMKTILGRVGPAEIAEGELEDVEAQYD